MKNYPRDFSAVVNGDNTITLTWSDEQGPALTAKFTALEARDFAEDLARKAAQALREEQRLRDLADDQRRAVTGMRITTRGKRAA